MHFDSHGLSHFHQMLKLSEVNIYPGLLAHETKQTNEVCFLGNDEASSRLGILWNGIATRLLIF